MNVCENEAVIAFDTLYTQNHIQILKILLPYFDPYGQNHLAVWIKYLELRYTLEYVSRPLHTKIKPPVHPLQILPCCLSRLKIFVLPGKKHCLENFSTCRKISSCSRK